MAQDSKIEWTDATWNPIVGCSVVSPGCTNCYAMKQAPRLAANPKTTHYAGTVKASKGGPVWTGKVAMAPDRTLTEPLRRRKPTMYFVNSMGDLFHPNIPDDWIEDVFAVMALCPQHTFQVLTKRPDRMRQFVTRRHESVMDEVCDLAIEGELPVVLSAHPDSDEYAKRLSAETGDQVVRLYKWPLPNVWLGVSAEDQTRADQRIPDLLATPAAIRFVSVEPMLGPVDLLVTDSRGHDVSALRGIGCDPSDPDGPDEYYRTGKLDWVICGGESGSSARPMHPDWARSLRDQCAAAGVPFFFKQWGEWAPGSVAGPNEKPIRAAHWFNEKWDYVTAPPARHDDHADDEPDLFRIGKRAAGRLLDGVVHDAYPTTYEAAKGAAE